MAISQHSDVFNAMINGPMKESSDGVATLEDVEVETFSLFCQFAYTMDYDYIQPVRSLDLSRKNEVVVDGDHSHDCEPISVPNEPLEVPNETFPVPDEPPVMISIDVGVPISKKKKLISRKEKFREHFELLSCYSGPTQSLRVPRVAPDFSNDKEASKSFRDVFFGYAKLYTFSVRYCIEDLTNLTLSKLHHTLKSIGIPDAEIMVDIVNLIDFVFEYTQDLDHRRDPLREMLTLYVATQIDTAHRSAEFHSLLERGGKFVSDLFSVLK